MKLEDTLFNWLQIQIVANERPDDNAARETVEFFRTALAEDHGVEEVEVIDISEDMLQVHYAVSGEKKHRSYDREFAYQLLHDINGNPRYNDCM